ncbi:MAG: response regulator [Spirochaetaceae bacterium]|nr:response regulator [Spirochaetaceae bacterium]
MRVLIIVQSSLLESYLQVKFNSALVECDIAETERQAITLMHSNLPDLIIFDQDISYDDMLAFLKQKSEFINTAPIPVIIIGKPITKAQISELSLFKVIKYFTKPIKIDVFLDVVGRLLKTTISLDTTNCLMEIHITHGVIFIEISQGLNQEKLILLKFRLRELITINNMETPKIILVMTDIALSFIDGSNLETLLNNILEAPDVRPKNIKLLSTDTFTKKLVMGHLKYAEIEIISDLTQTIGTMLEGNPSQEEIPQILQTLVTPEFDSLTQGSIQLRFLNDANAKNRNAADREKIHIAIVQQSQKVISDLKEAFRHYGYEIYSFNNSTNFMMTANEFPFDLVIIDLVMPGLSGYEVIVYLRENKNPAQILIYSSEDTKENIVKSLSLGVKGFFLQSETPVATIVNKAVEALESRI